MADERIQKAVWDWLLTCDEIRDLFFNFATAKDGDTVVAPLTAYADTVVTEYNCGATERQYDFSIARFEPISREPNSEDNIDALLGIEQIAAWVDRQAEARAFPTFPAGCTINNISILVPDFGYVQAEDEDSAKYALTIRIDYLKEGT